MAEKIKIETYICLAPGFDYIAIPKKVIDQLQVKGDKDTPMMDGHFSEKKYIVTIEPVKQDKSDVAKAL